MLELDYGITELRGADYNPRHIDDSDLSALAESIRLLGLVKPLIARGNLLVAGHQRTKALRALGIEKAAVYLLPRQTTTYDEIRFNQLHNGTDIASMKFSQIKDERLYVCQIKTGMRIALPLSLSLASVGLRLGTVVDRCRLVSRTDYLISAGKRKNSPEGGIHPDGLTKKFVAARKLAAIRFSSNPPTFHEIRSLSGRLYKDAYNDEFAQKLLGHTSENTTRLYLDERDNKAFVML